MSENQPTIVVGHFDLHGVSASVLAHKRYGAKEIIVNYPATSPEQLVSTLQNFVAAAPQKLNIIIVDIPVNLKDPVSFVNGLENLAEIHDVLYIDHHESSVQHLQRFRKVKTLFVGTSALLMNMALAGNEKVDQELAIVGAIGDRDPEVVRRGLLSEERLKIADGLDVMIRRPNGALSVARMLLENPERVFEEARAEAEKIPTAQLRRTVGSVAIAVEAIQNWGPKSLEKLAFQQGTIYAVGPEYVQRFSQWVVRAIVRWDILAQRQVPLPGEVAKRLWPTRNIIGHPAAPSIAAMSREEAEEMAERLASQLNEELYGSATPRTLRFINEYEVGRVLAEVLVEIRNISRDMRNMYREYLDLKRKQVELLERLESTRARAD